MRLEVGEDQPLGLQPTPAAQKRVFKSHIWERPHMPAAAGQASACLTAAVPLNTGRLETALSTGQSTEEQNGHSEDPCIWT